MTTWWVGWMRWRIAGAGCLLVLLVPTIVRAVQGLDDFEDVSGWSAQASPGASLEIAQDAGRTGNAMRLDFDFHGGAGFVIARKAFAITLPANYAFTFELKGDARPNTFEFKLVEPTNDNVWWRVQRDYPFAKDWQKLKFEMTVQYRRHTVTATVTKTPFFNPPRKRS